MKYGIIGAGPSGLTMGMFLKHPCEVFEKDGKPGGHAGSFYKEGYTFDYGPHIMFSRNKDVLEFMKKTLGENIHQSMRNNKISYKNILMKYPFENDLKSLPLNENYECLYTYLFNPYKKKYSRPKDLEQWLLKTFGKGICERYLFPYNKKVWNIPVKNLSMLWAERIPNPPKEDIIKSSIGFTTEGYLHQLYYHYPLRGGYQSISDEWAEKVSVNYNYDVKSLKKTNRNTFILSNGKSSAEFDSIISTMPIHELIKIVDFDIPQRVRVAISRLIVNPMFIVSLGIKGEDKNKYTAIYCPEDDFFVNRISFPKTFSPYNAPSGHYSIQAEITCQIQSEIWKMRDADILEHVISGLLKRNIVKKRSDVVMQDIRRSKYAYVIYDRGYEKNTKIVREWFEQKGIYLVGRFSYFEYVNVDGVVERSVKIAEKINNEKVDLSRIL